MHRYGIRLCLLVSLAVPAAGEQYWIAYEGDTWPEDVGWQRNLGGSHGQHHGGAHRTLDLGVLTLDSLHDISVWDFYERALPGGPDHNLGEILAVEWRLRVVEVPTYPDPAVTLFSATGGAVAFEFSEDRLISVFEPNVSASFEPGVFHDYRLCSADMQSYELCIDGQFALGGEFWQGVVESLVNWGDGVLGASSLAEWDYFRFGVVPEPEAGTLLLCATIAALRPDRRSRA